MIEATAEEWADKKSICVLGYPRSGTTWIARSIAHAVDCPYLGATASGKLGPGDFEGLWRQSDYVVRRSHHRTDNFHVWRERFDIIAAILVVRDPIDTALSAWHKFSFTKDYAGRLDCVDQFCGGRDGPPLVPGVWSGNGRRGWAGYVGAWMEQDVPTIYYKKHLLKPVQSLETILTDIGLQISMNRIIAAVDANRFEIRKKDIFMHRGEAGRGRRELEVALIGMIENKCGDVIAALGYKGWAAPRP